MRRVSQTTEKSLHKYQVSETRLRCCQGKDKEGTWEIGPRGLTAGTSAPEGLVWNSDHSFWQKRSIGSFIGH